MRGKTKTDMRPPDPVSTVGRYQRIRIIVAVVCVSITVGVLLWKSLAD